MDAAVNIEDAPVVAARYQSGGQLALHNFR
jgi:hypothetical protein